MHYAYDSTAFPILPEELTRLIFEISFFETPNEACNLCLVSKQVQRWIEPLLYSCVNLHSTKRTQLFSRTVRLSPKSNGFIAVHVKRLILTWRAGVYHSQQILSACTGLDTLVLWVANDDFSRICNILKNANIKPTQLSLAVEVPLTVDQRFNHPLFCCLTHLELLWTTEYGWTGKGLSTLVNLTHFSLELDPGLDAFHTSNPVPLVSSLMLYLPSELQVFICSGLRLTEHLYDLVVGNINPKIVVMVEPDEHNNLPSEEMVIKTYSEIIDDWCGVLHNENNFWKQAEDVVHKRHRKTVKEPMTS